MDIVKNVIATLEYALASGLCWIIDILDSFFGVMSGQVQVSYNKQPYYLINVFFENASVRNAYWAMALLGILLCFVFAIIAVAKKTVDAGDKMRQGMGDILTGLFKGIIIIVSLTFIMTMTLDLTNALLQRVTYAFNHSEDNDKPVTITYTDEEYAAMARVLNTIGNYSLNPSYNSRYNINSCFNEIRTDLQFLKERGAFALHYVTDENNPVSWQSELQKIVNAADLSRDLKLDVYDAGVTNAIVSLMKTMQQNSSFAPLQSYERKYVSNSSKVPLDRLIFLMCTMDAAKNPAFNDSPTVGDELRGAYYTGEKSIYNLESVFADFEISKINFIVLIAVAFKLIWDYAVIIINCVARIFNLLLLYLIAPPCIATLPLDEGGKMKQWTTAFVIQCFGVFGTIIAMRVMLLFIPIVIDNNLLLFDNYVLNLMAKVIIILGGMETAKRASGMVTGILADNAGMQAITASDMGESVRSAMDHGRNRVTGYGETGSLRKNEQGLRSMFGGGGSGGASGGGGGGGGDSLPQNSSGTQSDKDAGGETPNSGANAGNSSTKGSQTLPKTSAGTSTKGGTNGKGGAKPITDQQFQNLFGVSKSEFAASKGGVGSSGGGGSSIPKPPPMPVSNGQGKYVPKPPPMPVSNGQGKYVPTPPPMPASGGNGGPTAAKGPTATPKSQARPGGGFGTGNPGMKSDGTGPVMEMQDLSGAGGGAEPLTDQQFQNLFGVSKDEYEASKSAQGGGDSLPDNAATREWGSVEEFMASDGGFVPDAPGGGDSLPDNAATREWGSVEEFMASDGGFVPDAPDISQTPHYSVPQAPDINQTSHYTPEQVTPQAEPTKTPPPPRPPVSGAQRVKPWEDPLSNINWK